MKRILIVDDNEENLYLLQVLLEGNGYEVQQAANGSEALVKALANKQDLIISDILMPVMDGFTLCRALKADDRLKHIPLIFYTATYTDPKDEKLALDMGANAFIIKPTEPDEFMRRIEEILAANKDGKLSASQKQTVGDEIVLKEFNEVLINKLEQKMLSLEQANKEREAEIATSKQIEEDLRESERKFRETIINLDEGYYSVTLDGVLLEHNQAFSRILGFDQLADLKGKQMPDFWQNPDERNSYLKELAAKVSINGRQTEAKTKTGEKITVIISAHLVKDKESLPLRIEGVVSDITERKRFEDQLYASEAQLRAIVDSTPFPMALVDVEDDKIEYWSRSAVDLFGHTAPTTTEWYQLAYPDPEYRRDVIERWKQFLEKARLGGKPVNTGEYRVSCHDGSVLICELYATFLSDRLVVTFNNITAHKKAEAELKKRENLLQKVFDVLPIGLWFADKDGKLLRGNPAGVKIWGAQPQVSPSEYGIFKARRLPSGEELAPEDWALTHTIREGVTIVDELLEIDAFDGKKKVILNYTAPVLDENGTIQGSVIANLDITEQKRAEEALREKETQYRNLADSGLALIWRAGTDKLCNYFNRTWLKFTGRTLEQEMGNGWTEGVHPEDLDRCVQIYVSAFDKHEAFDMEYRLRHVGGEYRWIIDLGTPNYNTSGEFIGYIGHCFDITEKKTAEDVIKKLNETLEQRIKERTSELQENIDLLEETNRAFVGRELRIIELKDRIAELEKKT